jgi:hypothetical protein
MKPQPPEYVGPIFAGIFILMIIYQTIKAYNSGKMIDLHNIDLIDIGYIESENPTQNIYNITSVSVDDKKPNFESQQLYVDCIDALVALGVKKSESKKKAKQIFSTHEPIPSTVQEFLMIALRSK